MNYDELLAPAAKAMRPSGIRKFFDLAADMPHCISLGVGEPDFKTPWSVRDAGIRSLELGRTKYTANSGLASCAARSAITYSAALICTIKRKTSWSPSAAARPST